MNWSWSAVPPHLLPLLFFSPPSSISSPIPSCPLRRSIPVRSAHAGSDPVHRQPWCWPIRRLSDASAPDPVKLHSCHRFVLFIAPYSFQLHQTPLRLGVSVLAYCFARRTEFDMLTTKVGWVNMTWTKLCVMLVFIDSYVSQQSFFHVFGRFSYFSFT